MSILAIEGTYENGQLTLKELPKNLKKSKVVVTFLEEESDKYYFEKDPQKRHESGQELLASMRKGLNFGGEKFDREAMYEEVMAERDTRRD